MNKVKLFFRDVVLVEFFLIAFLTIVESQFTFTRGKSEIFSVGFKLAMVVLFHLFYDGILWKKKKITKDHQKLYGCITLYFSGIFALYYALRFFGLSVATLEGSVFYSTLPWLIYYVIFKWGGSVFYYGLILIIHTGIRWLFALVANRGFREKEVKPLALLTVFFTLLLGFFGSKVPEIRYQGHNFSYMKGYSSTDFSDYMVYNPENRLFLLDESPSLWIEKEEEMPILDGAEAVYPLYASVAKNIYKDIDKIEKNALETDFVFTNGQIVSFTNTVEGYFRLLNKDVDIFFGAMPSETDQATAKELGVEFQLTPIGKEAFVFFVEEDNPIENISSEDVRKIYNGEITNWKELGGENQKILAFQRPENSGSQVMMRHFMGEIPLKKPIEKEEIGAMGGVISEVARYKNEEGAMGYTFRYFLTGLHQEEKVKILSIDGVSPTEENISNGEYPFVGKVYASTIKGNPKPNVEKVLNFMVSDQGQELVKKSGYVPYTEETAK
ncbi:substrate-binding domain-containing protein [Peptoniphilus sp. KCTC 25270]|uniref:PstS family phosphate ABC transporter substrate-binding protein n=1 Tax=Peptoniphilus sp. KCTC 25270 TaxID=2897414 RepID=UPI001E40037E|nr:substrate-binding domain-containing protein [Peptoniphilus sp. KCTC 25270]MCD1146557.1 substrate-binding domain-containing protein [Peptoniphilus sp. KCTC 25270]